MKGNATSSSSIPKNKKNNLPLSHVVHSLLQKGMKKIILPIGTILTAPAFKAVQAWVSTPSSSSSAPSSRNSQTASPLVLLPASSSQRADYSTKQSSSQRMGNSAIHNAIAPDSDKSDDKEDDNPKKIHQEQAQPSPQVYIQTNDPTELPLWVPYTTISSDSKTDGDGNDLAQTTSTVENLEKQHRNEEDSIIQEVIDVTMRWCSHFVVPLRLCPWTASSLNSQGAVRIYVLRNPTLPSMKQQAIQVTSSTPRPNPTKQQIMEYTMEAAIHEASQQLRQDVQGGKISQKVAIAFCVMVTPSDNDEPWDFDSFYDWFFEFEDRLLEEAEHDEKSIGEYVTPAPFHPQWQFETGDDGDDGDALSFEKRSPYPTVSIVCTSEIEKAGEDVTQQIGIQNANTLSRMGSTSLQEFYDKNVYQQRSPPPVPPNQPSHQKPYAMIEDVDDDDDENDM
mmetsp:Transcript_28021/g.39390  ORF Transcript_28021/g.39390 Transcript_28021/m.39390 type:complete len:450 (+) Transcript_28021:30-1379(+)